MTPTRGRWIRPARCQVARETRPAGRAPADADDFAETLLNQARRRISGLVELERELEDKIRGRLQEAEAEVERRARSVDDELSQTRTEVEAEFENLRSQGAEEGRATGFREGFARGREEGHRLGVKEGRQEGLKEGRKEGYDEVSVRLENELAAAAAALTRSSVEFAEMRSRALEETRGQLIELAMEIARKLVKREVERFGDVALRNVEEAVELVYCRGSLVIQVHPQDVGVIEKALKNEPRWAEGMEAVEVRAASDVERGGCRLLSGAGTVDMTLKTQMELIEKALGAVSAEPSRSTQKRTKRTTTRSKRTTAGGAGSRRKAKE